ncbi:MAG: hypothetical protein AB7H81_14915 [Vicinamibacterales bacterium]
MRSGLSVRPLLLLTIGVLALAAFPRPVSAQAPGEIVDVEVEPITCWWRSSTSAVRSGEPFTLTLTCQVVETESTKVVPDQSKLDPAVVQLEPFEVIGGSKAPDMRVPGKRFFQYDYRLRLINEGAFGADVDVPQLQISYRVESQVARGEAVQGRDLNYNLRPISIRLVSIVPEDTMDIREAPAAAFQAVEAREARADMLRLVGTILFGLAGVVLLVMLVSLFRRRRVKSTADSWQVSLGSVASAVQKELAEVRLQSRGGWDDSLVGRALAAARLAATMASGGQVGQIRATASSQPLEGQLLIRGLLGRGGALVSGSLTPQRLPDANAASALMTFARARYGRGGALDSSALDEALDTATATAKQAASAHSWLADLLKRKARG